MAHVDTLFGYVIVETAALTLACTSNGLILPFNVANGTYDVGFGDINALIELAAKKPEDAPIAVYVMFNQPPFTRGGEERQPDQDAEGLRRQDPRRRRPMTARSSCSPRSARSPRSTASKVEHHQHAAQSARADADAGPGRRRASATSTPSASRPS